MVWVHERDFLEAQGGGIAHGPERDKENSASLKSELEAGYERFRRFQIREDVRKDGFAMRIPGWQTTRQSSREWVNNLVLEVYLPETGGKEDAERVREGLIARIDELQIPKTGVIVSLQSVDLDKETAS